MSESVAAGVAREAAPVPAVAPVAPVAVPPPAAPRRRWWRLPGLILGLLLLLFLLALQLIGLTLEARYHGLLDDLAAAGYPSAEHHWQGGWFGSEVLTLIGPPDGGTGPRLRIAARFSHGPRLADLARWPPPLASGQARITVQDSPRPLPPLRVSLHLGLDGTPGLQLTVPDVTYSGGVGQWQLLDLHADLLLADSGRAPAGNGGLGGLRASDPDGQTLDLSGLYWRLGLQFGADDLPTGELLLTLRGLQLGRTGGDGTLPAVLAAAGLRLGLAVARSAPAPRPPGPAASPTGERLEVTSALELDRLRLDHLELDGARLVLTLSGLDADTLTAWRQGLRDIDAASLSPSVRGLAQGDLLARLLPALLVADPRLRAEPVAVATADGPVSASLELGLAPGPAGGPTPWGGAPLAADFWLSRLRGSGELALPPALVRRWLLEQQRNRALRELGHLRAGESPDAGAPADGGLPPGLEAELAAAADAALAALLRERWLVPAAGRLNARFLIGDGLLTINGRTLPLVR